MALKIMGDDPFAVDDKGVLKCRIATLFEPNAFRPTATLVTVPGTHFKQRMDYAEALDTDLRAQGKAPLSMGQKLRLWEAATDLIVSGRNLQIRPDPNTMEQAFAADAMLQELVPNRRIQFLYARNPLVQKAIRERGEYWRISTAPQSPEETERIVRNSRIGIGGARIYYYNALRGTRYLTVQEFVGLAQLPDEALRQHLIEIRDYSDRCNRGGQRELAFYGAEGSFGPGLFAGRDLERAGAADLRAWHADMAGRFRAAVPPAFQQDRPGDKDWRSRLASCLVEGPDEVVMDEEVMTTIPPEFFHQIRWLPGGRIENGELEFDPIFSEAPADPPDLTLEELCDQNVRGFICNYLREFGELQYVNIGLIAESVRKGRAPGGHRAYIAEVLHRGVVEPLVRILRIQRWGITQHLDEGMELLPAITEAEEYTEYTLDRRLGCWELGMPLPGRIDTHRVWVTYRGKASRYAGVRLWTTYFERDFIPGLATDKIPRERYRDEAFTLAFAQLLGQAAAPNLAVGRTTQSGAVIFDGGDEVLILDRNGRPHRLVVADHAGTFNECNRPLDTYAVAYAGPVVTRRDLVPDVDAFAEAYVGALATRLRAMQAEYNRRRRAFDTLFKHSKQGAGTFSWRWARVLARLERTDVAALAEAIRQAIAQRCGKKCQPPMSSASPGSPASSSR